MKLTTNIKVKRQTAAFEAMRMANVGSTAQELVTKSLDDESFKELVPRRRPNGNKGTFGRVLVIAGSHNMAGAAVLAARGAFAAGCGMVKVLTPECNRLIIQIAVPEAILETYNEEVIEETTINSLEWATSILIGPGLSMDDAAKDLLDIVLEYDAHKPIVVDADALNIISRDLNTTRLRDKRAIVTPHLGEMSRLVGIPISEIQQHKIETAEAFSTHHEITVLLKDACSVIASPDHDTYENKSGNCGMATAGSGDVLSGIIAGLLAQGMDCADAAVLGAYIHGRAGDLAGEAKSEYSMTASDIIDYVGKVMLMAKR